MKVLSPYLNSRDPDGNTPLHLCILRGHLKCLETLISVGNDLTVSKRCDGSMPVHVVCYLANVPSYVSGGKVSAMIDLLNRHDQTDWTVRDDDGRSPLWLACESGAREVVEKVVESLESRHPGELKANLNNRGSRTGLKVRLQRRHEYTTRLCIWGRVATQFPLRSLTTSIH